VAFFVVARPIGQAEHHAGEAASHLGKALIHLRRNARMGVSLDESVPSAPLGGQRPFDSSTNAGVLEARDTDLTTLLRTEPRSVRDLIVKAVEAGGYQSRSVTSQSVTIRS
jgi:hypothetical protein